MKDDIVARLRLTPVLMRRDSLGQSVIDYEACKKYINNEGVKMMSEAANEIERLREENRKLRELKIQDVVSEPQKATPSHYDHLQDLG